jgi:hypothetical protein
MSSWLDLAFQTVLKRITISCKCKIFNTPSTFSIDGIVKIGFPNFRLHPESNRDSITSKIKHPKRHHVRGYSKIKNPLQIKIAQQNEIVRGFSKFYKSLQR